MTSIFISYGRTERPLIKQIATQLRRIYGDKQVWYDEDIAGGQHWEDVLRAEIAAREIFMFMISAKSVKSEYCIWETKEALRLEKKILPVLIEPLPAAEIPDVLNDFQYVDISEVSQGTLTADHILKLATAITPLFQEYQVKWQQKRRRTTLWRATLLSLAAIIVGAVITLAVTNNPPFPGGIAYVAAHENNVEIRVIDGGVKGLVRNLRASNPTTIPIQGLADGGIVPRPASDAGLGWSADGKRVAFVSTRDGDAEIYVMNADGSDVLRLTDNDSDDRNPTWSPDGGRIAFSSNRDSNWEIFVMNADGSDQQNISQQADADEKDPAWSPKSGSEKIAFASDRYGDWDIWRMESDGSGAVNLSNNFPEEDAFPAWSPDGLWIAFQSNQGEPINIEDPLSDLGIESSVPSAVTCSRNDWNIFAMDAVKGVNGALVPVAQNSLFNEQYPTWSPDGKFISYVSNQGGDTDLYMVRFNDLNGQPVLLNRDDGDTDGFPVWRS